MKINSVRVLDLPVPVTRQQIINQGYTQRTIKRDHIRAARGIYFKKYDVPTQRVSDLPIVCRARVAHLRRPKAVMRGWAAASYLGIPYFTGKAQVSLSESHGHNPKHLSKLCLSQTSKQLDAWRPDPYFQDLKSVTAAVALTDCLASIRSGFSWWTPHFPKLTPQEVMGIQVIDAFRSFTGLQVPAIEAAAHHRICTRQLRRLLYYSDGGADSPQESLLRLTTHSLAPDWQSQLPFRDQHDRLLTRADLGSEQLKVALFYDGDDHKTTQQMRQDKRVDFELGVQGWVSIRVCASQLRDPQRLRRDIQQAIRREVRIA